MEPGSDIDTAYVMYAERELRNWALSEDEPEGDLWDLYCDLAGVDPELFAEGVRYQRRKRAA